MFATQCIVCAILIILPKAYPAPVTYPWVSPCGVQSEWDIEFRWSVEIDQKLVVGNILRKLKDSRTIVDNIKSYYIEHRVKNLISDKPCEINIDSPAMQLDGFPEVDVQLCFQGDLATEIDKDYRSLSIMYIFNHQSWHDQAQANSSQTMIMYEELLASSGTSGLLVTVMCEMFSHNQDAGEAISDFASPSDMPDKYRNGTENEKHIRDFITLNKSYTLLSNLITKYEIFLSKLNS